MGQVVQEVEKCLQNLYRGRNGSMGRQVILLGYIEGPYWGGQYHEHNERLAMMNRVVLKQLPLEDEWPPLHRGMFRINDSFPGHGSYMQQFIHFGGSFNYLDGGWKEWLEKFEALLQRLYWYHSRVYLESEGHGDFRYNWRVTAHAADEMYADPPKPITGWEFEGGPREFREW